MEFAMFKFVGERMGERIGKETVEKMDRSGEIKWIAENEILNAMEDVWKKMPDSMPEKRRTLSRIESERARLGPRPVTVVHSHDGAGDVFLQFGIGGLIGLFLILVFLLVRAVL